MSNFECSPRTPKRRKTLKSGAASNAKAKVSASSYRGGSQSVSSISRNLFITKDAEDELISESLPVNVQDHANASKKDALCGGDAASALSAQMLKVHANESDSPDEITQAEVTVTPTKLQRNRLRPKDQTPKPSEKGGKARANGRKAEETPADIRSSGRERKRPRRFSNGWEDTVRPTLPEGIVTPSRKGNRSARKALAFEQDGHSVAEDLGLMDLDKHAQPKVARVTGKSGPYHNDDHNYVVQAQVDDEANQVHDGAVIDEAPNECQVRDEGAPDVPKWPGVATASATVAPQVLADSQLDPVKSLVLSRLTGHTLIPLIALEAEYSKLHSLLSATIKTGEGNSILLLGSRGVGKTCLVETAIADLTVQHAEDFHVVRLNGFLQTDDKLALREIWRQLGREMQVEQDETAQVNTYADTMASLLYLLSHPDELAETLNPNSPANTTKSVVFVLDEFDLFTSHVRQTLLYNLFDIAQARKAPIAVVGCSVRIDVVDALEKRVKSRYSHRWIHLSQAKSLPAFEDIAKAALTLREHDHSYAGRSIPARVRADWNTLIEDVFLPSSHIQSLLRQLFYTTKSIPELFSGLYMDIASIDSLDQSSLKPAVLSHLPFPDSVLDMLPYLPPLHLSLLVAAARLDAIHNATVVTFPLVYSHYVGLVSRLRLQASAAGSIAQATKLWPRDVAAAAWDELAEWELILPIAGKGNEQELTRMWRCDVVLEEILDAVGETGAGMSDVMVRWCKEI